MPSLAIRATPRLCCDTASADRWASLLTTPTTPDQVARAAALGWGRDPFLRGGGGLVGGFGLSRILWVASAPIAIINGEMLRPGEKIGAYQIIKIEMGSVTLSDGEQTLQLLISP